MGVYAVIGHKRTDGISYGSLKAHRLDR